MSDSPAIEVARNLVLQKVGRNLVNLQKLEAMLKQLHFTNQLEGSMSEIAEKAKRAGKSVSRMTMGQLIQELGTTLFDRSNVAQDRLDLIPEIWVSMKVGLEGGPEAAEAWKRDMSGVLEERNALAHQMLISFDPNSLESCEALGADLDSQYARISPVYEHFRSLVISLNESKAALLDIVQRVIASDRGED